jgi:hypothetical protein
MAGAVMLAWTVQAVVEAVNVCFQLQEVFNMGVLTIALQRLCDVNPVPLLLMRTILLTLQTYPSLTGALGSAARTWYSSSLFVGGDAVVAAMQRLWWRTCW